MITARTYLSVSLFIALNIASISNSAGVESSPAELPLPSDTATIIKLNNISINANEPLKLAAAIGSELFTNPKKNISTNVPKLVDDENNLRLLEVYIGKYKLDDLIEAYQVSDVLYIPLGFFCQITGIAITTDPTKSTAEGFILKKDRKFFLDADRGEVTIAGKLANFDNHRIAIREFDDIYVDSDLVSAWLPLRLDTDLYSSKIKIISREPLPLELRKQREEKIKLTRSRMGTTKRNYPTQIVPYRQWNYPLINYSASAGVLRNADDDINSNFTHSLYATADLLGMESIWYLTGTESEIVEDLRATLGKKDPTGSLLGQLKATEYAFGHINETSFSLITRPQTLQPGIKVSNYPLTQQTQYDSHSFRGNLPPGWEVELYRNNALLDYQQTAIDGEYQFNDVPLLYGNNYFRLVFYGPQGQQREENYNFNLNQLLTQIGKHHYRAVLTDDEDDGARATLQYDYGLNRELSFASSFASIPLDSDTLITETEEQHSYITLGIRGFHNALFYRSDIIKDTQGGSALDWEIQTRLGEVILNVGETYFHDNYISEELPETIESIERITEIKLDTAIPTSYFSRIPITFDMKRSQYSGNLVATRYGNRISMQKYSFAISNTLDMNEYTGLDTTVSGSFQVSKRAFGYSFRGILGYGLSPDSELNSGTITVDGIRWNNYYMSTGVSRVLDSKTDQVFFSFNRSHGAYALGLSSRYSTGGVIQIDLTFNISLGREPRSETWIPEYRPIASQGSLSVQAFVDENLNGTKDSDEQGVPAVKVQINGNKVPQTLQESGIVYITGLEPYRELDVDLAVESLEDPLWQPAIKGKKISLRPGHTAKIDFPIIITGEIDGTAYFNIGQNKQGVSGVIIELVDLNNNIVKTTKTEYDGFYLIDKIPAGKYELRVSREQTDSLNLLRVDPTFVIVDPKDPIVNGMDFVLQKRGEIPPSE